MKRIIAYYLFFFYASAMLKPVMPLVTDFIAHQFAHEHHIATVHSHNGEDHVHYELAAAADEQEKDHENTKQKLTEPISLHIFSANDHDLFVTPATNEFNSTVVTEVDDPLQQIIIPPPRFSFQSV
jgi:hypothetical protein